MTLVDPSSSKDSTHKRIALSPPMSLQCTGLLFHFPVSILTCSAATFNSVIRTRPLGHFIYSTFWSGITSLGSPSSWDMVTQPSMKQRLHELSLAKETCFYRCTLHQYLWSYQSVSYEWHSFLFGKAVVCHIG